MPALFFVLLFLISASSRAQEIIHFQAANTSILRDVKNGLHFANFVKHEFKYLKVTPFMSLLVPNRKKCQVWCVKDFLCLSFNVGVFPNSGGQLECELLATDMFNSSMNMTDNVNYHHYTIKTGCSPMPCKNNGACQPDYKTNTYSCHCECPYYGDNCEKAYIKTWGAWSNCSFKMTCPEFTRKRTKIYPISSCPENNDPNDTQTQICNISSHTGCNSPVGMQDGRIQNSQITASSYFQQGSSTVYAPWNGRLHKDEKKGISIGAWIDSASTGQYLQVDLGTVMTITKIATQGRPTRLDQYVTKYSLQYSTDNTALKDYENPQCIKVFSGNTDRNTVVTNALEVPIKARYVRIVVKKNYGRTSMRVELYGC